MDNDNEAIEVRVQALTAMLSESYRNGGELTVEARIWVARHRHAEENRARGDTSAATFWQEQADNLLKRIHKRHRTPSP